MCDIDFNTWKLKIRKFRRNFSRKYIITVSDYNCLGSVSFLLSTTSVHDIKRKIIWERHTSNTNFKCRNSRKQTKLNLQPRSSAKPPIYNQYLSPINNSSIQYAHARHTLAHLVKSARRFLSKGSLRPHLSSRGLVKAATKRNEERYTTDQGPWKGLKARAIWWRSRRGRWARRWHLIWLRRAGYFI